MDTSVTMSWLQMITSYGALGVVTAYFMYKDMTISQKLESTLSEFAVAMNTFFKVCGENRNELTAGK